MRERGIFFKTQFSVISESRPRPTAGNGGVPAGAAPGPSAAQGGQRWHRCRGGKGAERCYTVGQGSGEKGRAGESTRCGSSLPRAVACLGPWKPSSTQDAEGRRRAGAACSAPAQTPTFKKKPNTNNTTPRDAPVPLRTAAKPPAQHPSCRVSPSPALPLLPAPHQGTFAEQLSRSLGTS